ncbi:MAG: hypothetical protein ACI8PZ_006381 [Myxococcota bacterium]|jgi:hypothetical protein
MLLATLLAPALAVDLDVGPIVRGRPLEIVASEPGISPFDPVVFVLSLTGPGEGPCPAELGGACLDLLRPIVLGEAIVDFEFTATLVVDLPARAPVGVPLWFQVVDTWNGEKSAVIERSMGWGLFLTGDTDSAWAAVNAGPGGIAGSQIAGVGDVTGDGVDDAVAQILSAGSAGEVVLLPGGLWDRPVPVGALPVRVAAGVDETAMGTVLLSPGDLDGDGVAELLLGGREPAGGWLAWADPAALPASSELLVHRWMEAANASVTGPRAVGDVDGDGVADLLLGQSGRVSRGAAAIVPLVQPHGAVSVFDVESHVLYGETVSSRTGAGVALPDLDGDGIADVVVGAPSEPYGVPYAGLAYVRYGPAVGGDLMDSDAFLYPEVEASIGDHMAGGVDLDGDGADDLVLPGLGWEGDIGQSTGAVWLVTGAPEGDTPLDPVYTRIEGVHDYGYCCRPTMGDFDGDGQDDLALGVQAFSEVADDGGLVAVFYGPIAGGPWAVTDAEGLLVDRSDRAFLGAVVASPGDLDGDGYADLVSTVADVGDGGQLLLFPGGPGPG